ncbi:MAG: cysteine desulfurase [Chloroflexi bacterium]|nr:cysteine desulfurase [Chloroflexota bacterium]
MPDPIYLDYAATTPVDAAVLEAMMPYFRENFGNPSSIHRWGRNAEKAIEQSRRDIAAVLDCEPNEIIFTSCGTESDNLGLRGAAVAQREAGRGNHLITTAIEHHAVLHTAVQLRDHYGFDLTILPVDEHGRVRLSDVEAAIRPDTTLISVMYANNEIGTIQPIAEIAAIARARNIITHTDAVQAASQLDANVKRLGADMLALGAHKFYGPKGVGALYVRKGTPMIPAQTGGGHERGRRAGTSNVPYIVGMAAALKLVAERRETDNARYRQLRDKLIAALTQIPDSRLTGHPEYRLPNHSSFVFRGIDGNELLMRLDLEGLAASSGSACKTGDPEPSEVITALGYERDWALGSLRLTVGRPTTEVEVERAVEVVTRVVGGMK